jgi:hypothetical protein
LAKSPILLATASYEHLAASTQQEESIMANRNDNVVSPSDQHDFDQSVDWEGFAKVLFAVAGLIVILLAAYVAFIVALFAVAG